MSNAKLLLVFAPFLVLALIIYELPNLTFSVTSAKGEAFTVPTCEADSSGRVDMYVAVNKGSSNSFNWVETAACVSRPILEAWAVSHNPNEMASMGQNLSAIVQVIAPPSQGATHEYRVKYTVHDVIPISWTLEWVHQLTQGTPTDPQEVLITVSKYNGSSFLKHFAGSIRLERISPTMTLAAARIEIGATGTSENTVESIARHIIDEFRSGTPYWNGLTQAHIVDFE